MGQTKKSFSDKWHINANAFMNDILDEKSEITQWVLRRNGFNSFKDFSAFLDGKKRILDGGCGNGRITNLFAHLTKNEIIGIDYAAYDVAAKNLDWAPHASAHQGNLLSDMKELGTFDYIYCQEVLHHTGDAEKGFHNLANLLRSGGELAIYVYKIKAPVREFVDDYIRDQISTMPYDQAREVSEAITVVGKALAELGQKITVPEIPLLGIEAGEHDVQRFFYNFFMKCFWNPGLSWEENIVINYDWYHPQDCTRHTPEEVLGWYRAAGLEVTWKHVDPYGITVRGTRK